MKRERCVADRILSTSAEFGRFQRANGRIKAVSAGPGQVDSSLEVSRRSSSSSVPCGMEAGKPERRACDGEHKQVK